MERRTKDAKAKELLILYNSLEPRKITLSTLKRKIMNYEYNFIKYFRRFCTWLYILYSRCYIYRKQGSV